MNNFELKIREGARITPTEGEELGRDLQSAGNNMMAAIPADASPAMRRWRKNHAAVLFYLSADAFELGASVCLGHNRAGRYEEEAKVSRDLATACEED